MAELTDIVCSKVRAEIFRLLFGLDGRELYLREIVRQAGLAIGTIQQEVNHLTKSDLLRSRRDGNRLYFRANIDHPVFREIRSLVVKTTGLVPVLSRALERGDVQCAFIFGSIARHEDRAASDVDLMVIGDVSLRKLAGILAGPADVVGREINPHLFSADEFARRVKANDHFISTVIRERRIFVVGDEDELGRVVG